MNGVRRSEADDIFLVFGAPAIAVLALWLAEASLASRLQAFEGVRIQSDPRGTFWHPSHRPPEFAGHQPPGNRGQPRKNWLPPYVEQRVQKTRQGGNSVCSSQLLPPLPISFFLF